MRWVNWFLSTVITGGLVGCNSVGTYFPDKERDYQRIHEIPMLNWPAELRNQPPTPTPLPTATTPVSTIDTTLPNQTAAPTIPAQPTANPTPNPTTATGVAISDPTATVAPAPLDNPVVATDPPPYDISSEIPKEAKPPSDNDPVPDETGNLSTPVVVEQVKRDGASSLRMNVVMLRAWRAVDKALSRNGIEVTERNPEEHRYKIQYDPNEKKAKDGSWKDELRFMFKGFEIQEKPYRLKLVEIADMVEVQLVDNHNKKMADTPESIKLLDTLEQSIKTDLSAERK
jgi:outer membrane protein assembly factor BamC